MLLGPGSMLLLLFIRTNLKRAQASGIAYGVSQGIIFFAYAAAFRLGGHLVEIQVMTFDNVFL